MRKKKKSNKGEKTCNKIKQNQSTTTETAWE